MLSGRSEIGLDDRGRVEALRLAERLAATPLRSIRSSPRRRALETAEAVAEKHDLLVVADDALDEIDFGAWSGRRFDTLDDDPRWRQWNAERGSATTPAGEIMAAVAARGVAAAEADAAAGGEVLHVTHCDVIRGVVAHYLGLDQDRVLAFDCDPGSLTTLAIHPGGGRVVSLNERPL